MTRVFVSPTFLAICAPGTTENHFLSFSLSLSLSRREWLVSRKVFSSNSQIDEDRVFHASPIDPFDLLLVLRKSTLT